jgi:hypothetical protein
MTNKDIKRMAYWLKAGEWTTGQNPTFHKCNCCGASGLGYVRHRVIKRDCGCGDLEPTKHKNDCEIKQLLDKLKEKGYLKNDR